MNVKSKEAIAAVTEDGRLVDIGEEEKVKITSLLPMKQVEKFTGIVLPISWLRR